MNTMGIAQQRMQQLERLRRSFKESLLHVVARHLDEYKTISKSLENRKIEKIRATIKEL